MPGRSYRDYEKKPDREPIAFKWPDWLEGARKPEGDEIRTAADERAASLGYLYNPGLVDKVCEWLRRYCRHTQGRWYDSPMEVTDWQRANIIAPIYGWVTPEGKRRIRYASIWAPKKTPGKSFVASCLALLELSREPGARVISGGGDKTQAAVVHGTAMDIVELGPLQDHMRVVRSANRIQYECLKGEYRSVANDSPLHGPSVSAAIFDEIHEWKNGRLWEKLRMAQAARENPLYFVISNSGKDTEGFWYDLCEQARDIQQGRDTNLQWHGLVCEAEADEAQAELEQLADGGTSIEVFKRVNPQWKLMYDREQDVIDELLDMWRKPAEQDLVKQFKYSAKPKGYNRDWLAPYWPECQDDFTPEDFEGEVCYAGMDKGSSRDLSSLVLGFPRNDQIYMVPYFWITERRLKQLIQFEEKFKQWRELPNVFIFPGRAFLLEQFKEDVRPLFSLFDWQGVIYDSHKAELATQWMEEDHEVERITFGQSAGSYNQYTVQFEDLVESGEIRHNGCPLFAWQAGNAIRHKVGEYIMPKKSDPNDWRTVDSIQAACMIIAQMSVQPIEPKGDYYESNRLTII